MNDGRIADWRAFYALAAALAVWALVVLLSPLLIDPMDAAINLPRAWAGPSAAHPLGCDNLGRDVAARAMLGAKAAFMVAVPATALTVLLGGAAGVAAGMMGRTVDGLILALGELSQTFPRLALALVLGVALGGVTLGDGAPGGGSAAIIAAFVLATWPSVAQPTRAQIFALRQEGYVQAATALGASSSHMLRRHFLPGLRAAWLARAGGLLAQAVMLEAGLGFLGLGVQEPQASWGGMLRDGLPMIHQAPALAAAAGGALFVTALAVNLAADAAARRLDPRRH